MPKNVLIIGAGAIGRGQLAPLLSEQGHEISFADANKELIDILKLRDSYNTAITKNGEKHKVVEVPVSEAYHMSELETALESTDVVFMSVGPRNAVEVAERLKGSGIQSIISCENEWESVESVQNASNIPTYFGIPDVISSNTAPIHILALDELAVSCEAGELIIQEGNHQISQGVTLLSGTELRQRWNLKFLLHNTPHALAAYLGAMEGKEFLHEALTVPHIRETVSGAIDDLIESGVKLGQFDRKTAEWYGRREIERFSNEGLYDPISRVAREPLRKLRSFDRLIAPAIGLIEVGIDPKNIIAGITATFHYDSLGDHEMKEELSNRGIEGILQNTAGLNQEDQLYKDIIRASYSNIANEIVREIKPILLGAFNSGEKVVVEKETHRDIVTYTDEAVERRIKNIIKQYFPTDGIIGEETGETEGSSSRNWIIDPIDGTVNFANNLPLFCTSIAMAEEDQLVFGMIYNPTQDELFIAEAGQGATLNRQPITVSQHKTLDESVFTMGFKGAGNSQTDYNCFSVINENSRGVNRIGTAALNLAYVADGRYSGFLSRESPSWDVAAGALLVQEAGGEITDFEGNPYSIGGSLVATNGKVHQTILDTIEKS